MSNHEPDTSDVTWRDAWDHESVQRLLMGLARSAERSGSYTEAGTLSNLITWMDERIEEIAKLEDEVANLSVALDECWTHIKAAQALLEKAP